MGEGLCGIVGLQVVLLNGKAEELLGVSSGEAIGKNMREVITVLKAQ